MRFFLELLETIYIEKFLVNVEIVMMQVINGIYPKFVKNEYRQARLIFSLNLMAIQERNFLNLPSNVFSLPKLAEIFRRRWKFYFVVIS